METRVVIYARESSDDTNKAPPIQEQIQRAKQYIEEKGFEFIDSYEDNGYSGANRNRPAFNQLIKDARFHKFNLVIVFSQDRIARDTEQFLWFQRNLKESSVKLFSLIEGEINLDTVGDKAKNISLAMASDIFRQVTSDKVKKAYEMKKKKAKDSRVEWGRKPKQYDLQKIIELRNQGLGFREIAKQIGNCSYQTIRRLLRNTPKEKSAEKPSFLQQITKEVEKLQNNPIMEQKTNNVKGGEDGTTNTT